MSKKLLTTKALCLFVMILSLAIISGCGTKTKQIGLAIPSDSPVIKIANILNNPGNYNGKRLLLLGSIDTQCPSNCHFFFKTEDERIKIFPTNFDLPKLQKGDKAKVFIEVTIGEENIVYSALGIEILGGKKT